VKRTPFGCTCSDFRFAFEEDFHVNVWQIKMEIFVSISSKSSAEENLLLTATLLSFAIP
jgi:hypothetical protein